MQGNMQDEMQHQAQNIAAEQEQEVEQVDDSIVTDGSGDSGGSFNNINMMPQNQLIINHVRIVPVESMLLPSSYGPVIPPSLQIDKLLQCMIPQYCKQVIPSSLPVEQPFNSLLAKRDWHTAFNNLCGFSVIWDHEKNVHKKIIKTRPATIRITSVNTNEQQVTPMVFSASALSDTRGKKNECIGQSVRVTRSATKAMKHVQTKPLFVGRDDTQIMSTPVRRSARTANRDAGFKARSTAETSRTKKKARSAKPIEDPTELFIPIPVLQRAGQELEIPSEELSLDKLMAGSSSNKSKKVPNDE